jgi:hypothetical protein
MSEPLTTDLLSYRIVVVGLTAALVVTVVGILLLQIFGQSIPSELTTIAVPILTALAAILTPLDSLGLGSKQPPAGTE